MSFEGAETALFDLLFSAPLRADFARDPDAALAPYDLDASEREDFFRIRPAALAMDAEMRRAMVLSQLCVSFPITFSLASAAGDLGVLAELVDPALMRAPPRERSGSFGQRLRRTLELDAVELPHGHERVAVVDAELGMARTGAALLESTAGASDAEAAGYVLPENWSTMALGFAPFVSASLVPGSYAALKAALCPVGDRLLYRHLVTEPMDPRRVDESLKNVQPRVLIARAHLDRASTSDPEIHHETLELADGFATMLNHVDGKNSAETLLDHLAAAGADTELTASVRVGFRQLVENRMLELSR